jgi:hypothetical protein
LEAIAENGDNAAMAALLGDAAEVTDVYTNSLPLLPVGNAVTFTIQARSGDRLSLAMMLICTNDGFVGLDSVELPRFGSSVFGAFAYDAGTETNSERSEDLPDNCSTLGPVPLDGDPNGNANEPPLMSHPVTPHPGLQGTGDLSAQHQWLGAAAKVTVVQIAASSPLLLAPLSGLAEVPPVMTPTKGAAGVVLLANEDALAFMVLVINATNVTAAHIHYGLPNENGPIVATLLQTSEPISDTVNGILTSGLITADEVAEVFEGGFDAFVGALFTGQLYVNVHTADHPDGEVRGQLGVVPLQLHPPMSLEALLNQATPDGIDGSTIYLPMLSQ